jgi:hypothetical protein
VGLDRWDWTGGTGPVGLDRWDMTGGTGPVGLDRWDWTCNLNQRAASVARLLLVLLSIPEAPSLLLAFPSYSDRSVSICSLLSNVFSDVALSTFVMGIITTVIIVIITVIICYPYSLSLIIVILNCTMFSNNYEFYQYSPV